MKVTSKIIVTIIAIVVFFFAFSIITEGNGETGQSTPGILGLIAFAGLIGGLRAVWKKTDDNTSWTDIDKM